MLRSSHSVTCVLLDAAIKFAGSPRARSVCDMHLADEYWSHHLVLGLQEYARLLPEDTGFHLPTRVALASSAWPANLLKVLEVGPYDCGLLEECRRVGAAVTGLDLVPRVRAPHVLAGDFMTADLSGPFDLLLATSVFETGSTMTKDLDSDVRNCSVGLLDRLREVIRDGGCVVLENLRQPLPSSPAQARAAGFTVLDHRVPSVNAALGGRGCALQRQTASLDRVRGTQSPR